MTHIQQVLFTLETPYRGHPYYVTGHALYSALARRVDARTRRRLHVSTGVFVPGEYGAYPEWHTHAEGVPYLGTGLRPVRSYEDLFLFRHPTHRWLSDTRPREAHNTHDYQSYGGRAAMAPKCWFGRPPEMRTTKRSVQWYVHCYLHAGREGPGDVVPLADETLDGLRVGGARNHGFGRLALEETQLVDLDALDYSAIEPASTADTDPDTDTDTDTDPDTDAKGTDDGTYQLELLSPYVLASEHPDADSQAVPWWWDRDTAHGLRRRTTRLADGDQVHDVATIDHGQVVTYAGDDPVATAINGILRVGTHAKYGFGEFRVWAPDPSTPAALRRPPRATAAQAQTDEREADPA